MGDELTLSEQIALEEEWEAKIRAIQSPDHIQDLDEALVEEEKELATHSLYNFVKLAWPLVDSSKFQDSWHVEAICEHLEAAMRREIRCLLINIPPRHSKSLICGVLFPCWLWAQEPKEGTWAGAQTDLMCASYAQTLVLRDAVRSRMLLQSPWFQRNWGVGLRHDQGQKGRYTTALGGTRLSISVGGAGNG